MSQVGCISCGPGGGLGKGGKSSTKVVDSRWDPVLEGMRRRRVCDACGFRWSTIELDVDQVRNLLKQLAAVSSTASK